MMSIVAAVFSVMVSLIIPVGVLLFFVIKKRRYAKAMLLGALTFLVFQVLTRIPLLQWLMGYAWASAFAWGNSVLYALILSFTAGLFEETGRYIVMKLFMKKTILRADGLAFGFGHGAFEAALIVGINMLLALFIQREYILAAGAQNIFFGGIERVSAIIFHMAMSMLVAMAVRNKKPILVLVAIAAHTLFNSTIVVFKNIWVLEAVLLAFAIVLFVVIWLISKEKPEKREVELL